MRYYYVLFRESDDEAIARDMSEELLMLPDDRHIQNWETRKLQLEAGKVTDYLGSDLGCRLCSTKLRDTLSELAGEIDELQWLDVEIRHPDGKWQTYYILHFPTSLDVLDRSSTIYAGDFVVKPVLSKSKCLGHHVFSYAGGGSLPLFVTEPVRNTIEERNCTGIEFSEEEIQ